MSKKSKAGYIERIRKAMETDPKEMSRGEYIDALEEIEGDISGMLEAAREEQRAEQGE